MVSVDQVLGELWFPALQSNWVITLFRDEVWPFHADIIAFFETVKGYNKRISEVKECQNQAYLNAGRVHRERRKFLRVALKELSQVLTDQPGLLGPKALTVFAALSFAKDEVNWLLKHGDNPPAKAVSSKKGNILDDLVDRQLPELLFHSEELRALVRKYNQVLQRYACAPKCFTLPLVYSLNLSYLLRPVGRSNKVVQSNRRKRIITKKTFVTFKLR
jgi:NCK-associated protein 1